MGHGTLLRVADPPMTKTPRSLTAHSNAVFDRRSLVLPFGSPAGGRREVVSALRAQLLRKNIP